MNRASTLIAAAVVAAWPLAAVSQGGASSGGGTTRYDAPPPNQRANDGATNPGTGSSGASGSSNPGSTGTSDSVRATTGNQGTPTGSSTATTAALSAADRNFVAMAASGGMLEVEASRLALERAQSAELRDFARRMVDEHSKVNAELMEIVRTARVTDVPPAMNPRHRGMLERLRALNGQDFDRHYAEQIGVASHHETVALFERASREATHPEVKAFATKTLTNLRTHLQQSQQVAAAVGVPADRIQAAGSTSSSLASSGSAPGAATRSGGGPVSGTTGLDRTTGLSDAEWESGRASRYSLLPWTSYGYVGLNLGRSNWGDSCEGISGIFDCDDSAFSGKIYTGGLISRMVGLEIGYVNFGRPDTAFGNWKAHGINASIVANLPVDPVNLFARFGTTYGWTTTPAGAGARSGDDDGFGISYGAGLGFDITPQFQVTAEWDRTRFNFVNEDQDLDMYSLGVRYKF